MSVASPDRTVTPERDDELASGLQIDGTGATSVSTDRRKAAVGEVSGTTSGDSPRLTVVPNAAEPVDQVWSRQWPPTADRRTVRFRSRVARADFSGQVRGVFDTVGRMVPGLASE